MAQFTFLDFTVFAGATKVNEDSYVTIAKGVLGYLKNQYGIFTEVETITHPMFLESGQRSVIPTVYPITSVYRIWYDDGLVDDTTYSYYGEDVLFTTAFTDVRIPVKFELDVGYPDGVPDDLILAVYRHILAAYHSIDKHSDNVSKTINADGNTTYFLNEEVPLASKNTYAFYAGKTQLTR